MAGAAAAGVADGPGVAIMVDMRMKDDDSTNAAEDKFDRCEDLVQERQ